MSKLIIYSLQNYTGNKNNIMYPYKYTPSGAWKNEGPLVSNCHTMYHGPPPPRQESRWGATRGTVITVKASGGMDTGNITERLPARSCAAHRHARATMQGAEGPREAEHAPA